MRRMTPAEGRREGRRAPRRELGRPAAFWPAPAAGLRVDQALRPPGCLRWRQTKCCRLQGGSRARPRAPQRQAPAAHPGPAAPWPPAAAASPASAPAGLGWPPCAAAPAQEGRRQEGRRQVSAWRRQRRPAAWLAVPGAGGSGTGPKGSQLSPQPGRPTSSRARIMLAIPVLREPRRVTSTLIASRRLPGRKAGGAQKAGRQSRRAGGQGPGAVLWTPQRRALSALLHAGVRRKACEQVQGRRAAAHLSSWPIRCSSWLRAAAS
jgi:hypothetical protein